MNWINVEDEMPDGYIKVLAVNEKGRVRIAEYEFYDGIWVKPNGQQAKHIITHWMPLPEPPEAKEEG